LPASQSREIIRIPLGYDVLKAGKLQFELQDLENLPQGLRVYLVDLERNTYTDLQQTKIYSTQISKGRSDKRFELVLSEEAITEPGKLLNLPMSVFANLDKFTVNVHLEKGKQAELVLSTLSGQVIKRFNASAQETV